MSCLVYCIAPRAEQIESVLRRLRSAGVDHGDISIVIRGDNSADISRNADQDQRILGWWPFAWYSASLLLATPAVWPLLWWRPGAESRATHTILSLRSYRAGRRRSGR